MNKIKETLNGLDKWRIARKVRKKLARRYEYDYELELLNEKWIIKRIQDGQVQRRKELAEKQARIQEIELFIKFLNKL